MIKEKSSKKCINTTGWRDFRWEMAF